MQKSINKEIWKDIKNYEGLYQVSNHGNVKSLSKIRGFGKGYHVPEKILKFGTSKGYQIVALCKNSIVKYLYVHKLVLETFIPNPENLHQGNHKDENKLNNYVDNLEWCSMEYNQSYGTKGARTSAALKGRIRSEETRRKISETRKNNIQVTYNANKKGWETRKERYGIQVKKVAKINNGIVLEIYDSVYDAALKNNFKSHCLIWHCCASKRKNGTNRNAYGYEWQFVT